MLISVNLLFNLVSSSKYSTEKQFQDNVGSFVASHVRTKDRRQRGSDLRMKGITQNIFLLTHTSILHPMGQIFSTLNKNSSEKFILCNFSTHRDQRPAIHSANRANS